MNIPDVKTYLSGANSELVDRVSPHGNQIMHPRTLTIRHIQNKNWRQMLGLTDSPRDLVPFINDNDLLRWADRLLPAQRRSETKVIGTDQILAIHAFALADALSSADSERIAKELAKEAQKLFGDNSLRNLILVQED